MDALDRHRHILSISADILDRRCADPPGNARQTFETGEVFGDRHSHEVVPRFAGCSRHTHRGSVILELDTAQSGLEHNPSKAFIRHHDIRATAKNCHRLRVPESPANSLFGHTDTVNGRKR